MPLAMSASKIELGPTSGQTSNPFSCAAATSICPGSATPGQPASLMIPIFLPCASNCKNSDTTLSSAL